MPHLNSGQIESQMKLRPSRRESVPMAHSYFSVMSYDRDGNPKKLCADFEHNVFPSSGLDYLHNMAFTDTSASKRAMYSIAVTGDTTQTINAAQTALTGEITTVGLARADATTHTHTNGTSVSTVEHTFTISGAGIADVTRAALFNVATAPVSGVMGPFAAFSNGATGAMSSGETLKVTVTITTS